MGSEYGSYDWWRTREWEAQIGQLRSLGLFDIANRQADEVHARVAGYFAGTVGEQEFYRRLAMHGGANGERDPFIPEEPSPNLASFSTQLRTKLNEAKAAGWVDEEALTGIKVEVKTITRGG